jgi:hypothetical protein
MPGQATTGLEWATGGHSEVQRSFVGSLRMTSDELGYGVGASQQMPDKHGIQQTPDNIRRRAGTPVLHTARYFLATLTF